MPLGKVLTAEEKAKVAAYYDCGLSIREIAVKINRSKTVVHNCISLKENYGNAPRTGRPKALNQRDVRKVLRLASTGNYSAGQIRQESGVNVTARTVINYLHNSEKFVYRKKLVKPPLTELHKRQRLAFAQKYMSWTVEWTRVIFSDEKKFNLDGPDGYAYYWHDLRKEPKIFSRRQFGGGSVMIWSAIGFNGNSSVGFLDGRINSTGYTNMLETHLLPFVGQICDSPAIFQQDNAAIHNSRQTRAWLSDQNLEILDWPSRSPDMNIIENVWGYLSRKVYANGHQFLTKQELIAAIEREWYNLDQSYIQSLFLGMNNRIFELVRANGNCTKY